MQGTLRKQKRPSGSGTWGVHVVANDEHGTWLYTPQGSTFFAEKDGTSLTCFVGTPEAPGLDVLQLVPTNEWWVAHWTLVDERLHLAIDLATPATRTGTAWVYEDLELDLVRVDDGPVTVLDEDELADAVLAGHVTTAERDTCHRSAELLVNRMGVGEPLFGTVARDRLRTSSRAGLPPFPALP